MTNFEKIKLKPLQMFDLYIDLYNFWYKMKLFNGANAGSMFAGHQDVLAIAIPLDSFDCENGHLRI